MGMFDDLIPGQKAQGSGMFDDLIPKADPQIGNPQELTFAEKYIAPLLDKAGTALQSIPGDVGAAARAVLNNGNLRGSALGGAMQGAADPGVAIAQIVGNLAGQGNAVNQAVRDKEAEYQQARKEDGRSGFDAARLVGNTGMMTFMAGAMPPIVPGAPAIIRGAGQGAALGALEPVTSGDSFGAEKAKQIGINAAAGAVLSPLASALARVISPNASTNTSLQLLRDEGVSPTIGQSLGGWANALEEKAMSVPFMGDAIRAARGRAVGDFNNAAINRAVAPIGQRVEGAGQDAIAQAGDKLSSAYEGAASKVNHVNFDTPQFNADFGQLRDMASQGLSSDLAKRFDYTLNNVVLRRMSPNGSIAGSDLKSVDSELGREAAKYGGHNATPSEQEYGDAVRQLQSIVRQETARTNPDYAAATSAADAGWANLVRVERAGARAVNSNGVFTPSQLNLAVRSSDNTVRDRATARGTALMQDLSGAGQDVLANRVPNSGTTDRVLAFAAGTHPAMSIPAAALGATAYSRPVQNALAAMVASRPQGAQATANYLRQILPRLAPAEVAALQNRER